MFDSWTNKTAAYFNNIVCILVAKISSKKDCEKMEYNSKLEKVLLVCNRHVKLLRLVEATLASKMASLRRMMKEKFDNFEKFAEKKLAIFYFICLSLLTFEMSNISLESVRKIVICSLSMLMTVLYLKLFSIL